MDAATIVAVGTATAAVIAAVGGVVQIILKRPRLPVAEEVLEQLEEMRAVIVAVARWAHDAQVVAARSGIDLPEPPEALAVLGRREGEGRHDKAAGWRAAVKAATGDQPVVDATRPLQSEGPTTWPERRRPRLPPPPRP
jgi:hypothetical protein